MIIIVGIGRYTTHDAYISDTSFDYGTTEIPIDFTDAETSKMCKLSKTYFNQTLIK